VSAADLTGADWAAAPLGTCTRCGRARTPVLPRSWGPWEEWPNPTDPLFAVPLCAVCHPNASWAKRPKRRDPLATVAREPRGQRYPGLAI
jgi:hypothetical protein